MRLMQWLALPTACLFALLLAGTGRAQLPDGHQRAGNPQEVSPWARPSDTGRYVGYLVGGGAVCRGDGPTADEGTWGWDYTGLVLPALTAGFVLLFIVGVREFTIPLVLYSQDNVVLSVLLWQLFQSGQTAPSAALASIIVAVVLPIIFVARRTITRRSLAE